MLRPKPALQLPNLPARSDHLGGGSNTRAASAKRPRMSHSTNTGTQIAANHYSELTEIAR